MLPTKTFLQNNLNPTTMLDITTSQPVKDLIYACQSFIHYYDEYESEQTWEALKRETDFLNRIRELVPACLDWIKQDRSNIDCE